jgi:hypothetical protein
MKKKIYLYISVLLIISASSCTKNFDKLNVNPSQLTAPDIEPVLTQVFKTTADRSETENINTFWEYGHLIEPTGQRYNAGDDALWQDFYVTGLGNLRQIKTIYANNPKYTNRVAIANVWECYLYYYLVATYGPIPYSKAGQSTSHIPYDDETAIFASLLSRLKDAATTISGNLSGDKLATDFIYGGDLTKWLKFTNSLRLKIALTCQRSNPTEAIAAIKDVMSNEATLLQSDADDPKFTYGTADGSQSQYWTRYIKGNVANSGWAIMSDFSQMFFRSYKDPRMMAYFNKSAAGYSVRDTLPSTTDGLHHIVTYLIPYAGAPKATAVLPQWGITGGTIWGGSSMTNSFSTMPGVNATVVTSATSNVNLFAADRPFYFMTYAEICFMEAEANQLGYGGKLTADQYYYAGINASFAFWGLTQAQATAYEAQNGIKWSTSARGFDYVLTFSNANIPADNLTKIWIQQWLNYYDDGGFDAWVLNRRQRFLILPPHTNPGTVNLKNASFGDLPDRYPYPTSEGRSNPLGVADGVKLLGGSDYPSTQLKFAKPYTYVDWSTIVVSPNVDYSMLEKWFGTTLESLQASGTKYTEISKY